MKSVTKFCQCLINPRYATTGLKVALVVGSILFIINHGSAVITGQMNHQRWLAAVLTYIVPYIVNVHGQFISRNHS